MDSKEFRIRGKEMIDLAADYLDNIEERKVIADVKPGYIRDLIPDQAPYTPDKWEDLIADIERVIMPGVTHWHSPHFHAYFPTANSYPAICADILSDAISCIGFSWVASPACTELEVVMMDWLAKMLDLPDYFLASSGGLGGGVIQVTASEGTYVGLLAAKNKKLAQLREKNPNLNEKEVNFVAYVSQEAHSCGERASLLANVHVRKLEVDQEFSVRGPTLEKAIQEDLSKGFIPFYFSTTLGTTSVCSFDNLSEIGPICQRENIWMHVDAAYAGSAFVCQEYRYLMEGVEYSDSFCFNPHKWMLVNFDCSAFWIKNRKYLIDAFHINPIFLQHEYQNVAPDFRDWQVPFGRRFRSLKLWFVLRLYGIKGIQDHIRNQISLANYFENLIKNDDRFEIIGKVVMGLVCFRLKGSNEKNEHLLKSITKEGLIFMVPGKVNDVFFTRFAICASSTEKRHIDFAHRIISKHADIILNESN